MRNSTEELLSAARIIDTRTSGPDFPEHSIIWPTRVLEIFSVLGSARDCLSKLENVSAAGDMLAISFIYYDEIWRTVTD